MAGESHARRSADVGGLAPARTSVAPGRRNVVFGGDCRPLDVRDVRCLDGGDVDGR